MTTKLECIASGHWRSEDGHVEITLDDSYETECEASHPVRMKLSKLTPEQIKRLPFGHSIRGGYATWVCPGGEIHFYSMWTAQVDGEWTSESYNTFAEARGAVEEIVGPTKLGRRHAEPVAAPEPELTPEAILQDELAGIEAFLASAAETLAGPMGEFLDMGLVERNERRKAELEARLSVR